MIGRRILQVRICTCPKRDLEQDEKNREKQLSKSVLGTPNNCNKQPGCKRKAYWVLVRIL